MPRDRVVVMGKLTAKESHDAAIKKAIKLHSPYEAVGGALCGIDEDEYGIVYTAPLGGDRKVVATRTVRSNATKLRDLLSEAWAEGHWSSGQKSESK